MVGAATGEHGAVLLVGARRGIRHGHCLSYTEDLQRLYPQLKHYATEILQSSYVLRFLGYRVTKAGQPRLDFARDVVTTVKELLESTCVKHLALQNLLKMYDKFGQVLLWRTS